MRLSRLTLAIFLLSSPLAFASDCRRLDLQPNPSWLSSGAWDAKGTDLVLPDTRSGHFLRYRRENERLVSIDVPSSSTLTRPAEIARTENGLVIFDIYDRLVGVTESLEPKWQIHFGDLRPASGERLELFLWFIGVDRDFIGIAATANESKKEKWLGIARLQLGASPSFERLRTLPSMFTEDGSFYFLHEGPYLAASRAATYALFFGKAPHIERVLPAPTGPLKTFPAGYQSPALGMSGRENTVPSAAAWERATAPVGLFGRGGFLYLLARQPRADHSTRWTIFQIDPARDQMVRSMTLPTHAPHLVVVPGPREWAVIEKGHLVEAGNDFEQQVRRAIFIRSSLIEDPTSKVDLAECLGRQQ